MYLGIRDQLSVKLQLHSKTDSLQFSTYNEPTSSSFIHYLFTFSSTGIFSSKDPSSDLLLRKYLGPLYVCVYVYV